MGAIKTPKKGFHSRWWHFSEIYMMATWQQTTLPDNQELQQRTKRSFAYLCTLKSIVTTRIVINLLPFFIVRCPKALKYFIDKLSLKYLKRLFAWIILSHVTSNLYKLWRFMGQISIILWFYLPHDKSIKTRSFPFICLFSDDRDICIMLTATYVR